MIFPNKTSIYNGFENSYVKLPEAKLNHFSWEISLFLDFPYSSVKVDFPLK